MGRFKVAISDCDHGSVDIEREVFAEADMDFELYQCRTEDEVIARCGDAQGIISQYAPIKAKAIAGLSRCKVLSRYGVGVDNLDVDAATQAGIAVCNVPDYCQDEVSTHALALLLDLVRKVTLLNNSVKSGNWNLKVAGAVPRTAGKTLGLLGYGQIARVTARKALGFDMQVIAYDPYIKQAEKGVELVDFETLLARSDFLSIHAPLTPETRKIINSDSLGRLKKGACLVNTSRGGLVDEAALARALKDGRLAGAALDVLSGEPPERDNPLLGLPQVIITPHASYFSDDSFIELKSKAARNVVEVLTGASARYCLNPKVLR